MPKTSPPRLLSLFRRIFIFPGWNHLFYKLQQSWWKALQKPAVYTACSTGWSPMCTRPNCRLVTEERHSAQFTIHFFFSQYMNTRFLPYLLLRPIMWRSFAAVISFTTDNYHLYIKELNYLLIKGTQSWHVSTEMKSGFKYIFSCNMFCFLSWLLRIWHWKSFQSSLLKKCDI